MDFHARFLLVSFFSFSKVEFLWPPCPLHRTAAEKNEKKQKRTKNEIFQRDGREKNEKDMPCAFNMQTFFLDEAFFFSLSTRLRYGKFAWSSFCPFPTLKNYAFQKTQSYYITNTRKW
jgi:hypothetical protein